MAKNNYDIPLDMSGDSDDLYPKDEDKRSEIISWVTRNFQQAEAAKNAHMDKWLRYYQMYRSYIPKRTKGDWKSRVWIPLSFYLIETIAPKLVAQLPKWNVYPVGPEDTESAKVMERLLDWAADRSDLYLELVKAFKSSLIYGTGIIKTMYDEKVDYKIIRREIMEDITVNMPSEFTDLSGAVITEPINLGQRPTGEYETVREPYVSYSGPVAESVDIANFYPAPEADSIESARYVVHRIFRTRKHLERLAKLGVYTLPEGDEWDDFLNTYDYPAASRLASIALGPGSSPASTEGLIEILEVWTDDAVVAVAGRKVLIRAERNPFAHGEKPFVRLVDHIVPHEFWGIGELEPMEGIQDTLNALWNGRIDSVKLALNSMFAVSMDYLYDPKDLQVRPGGVIRMKEGIPVEQAFRQVNLGDVTGSAYTEAHELENLSEKISGVSAYQMGMDSPALNRTATGVALISEQGNTRFGHKLAISELTGLRRLARHFGVVLQQYMPPEMAIRILGPQNQVQFMQITPESVQGAFDYQIEAESSAQTETVRKEQAMTLFNMLVGLPEMNRQTLIEDILEVFGRKDKEDYFAPPPPPMPQPGMPADPNAQAQGEQGMPPEMMQMMMQQGVQ
jgi:hypothetical protein